MIPHDYHMHTSFSPDSSATMEAMCLAAVELGIPEIGFTEHYDLHPDEWPRDWFKPKAWFAELARCREVFRRQLVIRAGIEIGEPHIFQEEMQKILASGSFDYVLGSLHWVGRRNIFDKNYFARPADEAFGEFFAELERMTRAGGFDILSHFDVAVRVGYEVYGAYDPRRYEEVIRAVLRNCLAHGIALDINTAALRRKYAAGATHASPLLSPGLDILRWYKALGGERVTLGSDAHRPDHVGSHLGLALQAVRAAGFDHLTFFEGRRARLAPLPA
jgi:histidinol-phosphatase (PHP family)